MKTLLNRLKSIKIGCIISLCYWIIAAGILVYIIVGCQTHRNAQATLSAGTTTQSLDKEVHYEQSVNTSIQSANVDSVILERRIHDTITTVRYYGIAKHTYDTVFTSKGDTVLNYVYLTDTIKTVAKEVETREVIPWWVYAIAVLAVLLYVTIWARK